MKKGHITGLQRHLGTVTAMLDSGQPITATPLNGVPPPQSVCWFTETGPGSWLCLGTIADRRLVLHEDWLLSSIVSSPRGYGDTAWRQLGTLGTIAQSGATGLGKTLITCAASNWLALCKEDNAVALEATRAVWLSAKFAVITDLTNVNVAVGFVDDGWMDQAALVAGDAAVTMQYNPGLGTTLFGRCINGTASTSSAVGNVLAVDTYTTIDIVARTDFAAFWMDGVGPTVITTNIPTGTAFQPAISVLATAASARNAVIDWMHVEEFSAVVVPS